MCKGSRAAVALLLAASWARSASAQVSVPAPPPAPVAAGPEMRQSSFGLDADVAIPIQDWSHQAGIGLGALIRYEQGLAGRVLSATGRIGYVYHLSHTTSSSDGTTVTTHVSTVPLLAGIRLTLLDFFFLHAELGPVLLHISSDTNAMPVTGTTGSTSNDVRLMLGTGAGLRIRGLLVGGYLQIVNLENPNDTVQVAVTLGYDFITF